MVGFNHRKILRRSEARQRIQKPAGELIPSAHLPSAAAEAGCSTFQPPGDGDGGCQDVIGPAPSVLLDERDTYRSDLVRAGRAAASRLYVRYIVSSVRRNGACRSGFRAPPSTNQDRHTLTRGNVPQPSGSVGRKRFLLPPQPRCSVDLCFRGRFAPFHYGSLHDVSPPLRSREEELPDIEKPPEGGGSLRRPACVRFRPGRGASHEVPRPRLLFDLDLTARAPLRLGHGDI